MIYNINVMLIRHKLLLLIIVSTNLKCANKWTLASVDSHVCFESTWLVKLFTTARPLTPQLLLLVVTPHVRCQRVGSEV